MPTGPLGDTGADPEIYCADRVFTGERLLTPGWVQVRGDRVVTVAQGPPPARAAVRNLGPVVVAPGFVDLHCHGGGGYAFTDGLAAARHVVRMHAGHGTTAVMASLVTDAMPTLATQIAGLAPLVAAGEVLGVHLEGPWLAERHRGAHSPALLTDPVAAQIDQLLSVSPGAVRMVTLAPERPGGLAAVGRLVDAGVVAAIGHSCATYEQGRAAIEAGASVVTHLYNAHRAVHQREPGLALAALEDRSVTLELIADGVHVHRALVRDTLRTRAGRVALVTDAMAAAGAADGRYRLGPLDVVVTDGVARVGDTGGPIAGSTLTLDRAVRYAVHSAGVELAVALTAVTRTPADALGRPELGRLAPGARADLVALDAGLRVVAVRRRGLWLP